MPGEVFETDKVTWASTLQARRLIGRAIDAPPPMPTPQPEPPPPAVEPEPDDIEPEIPDEYPVHKGGGYYVLPDGRTIKGREAALEAMRGDA